MRAVQLRLKSFCATHVDKSFAISLRQIQRQAKERERERGKEKEGERVSHMQRKLPLLCQLCQLRIVKCYALL